MTTRLGVLVVLVLAVAGCSQIPGFEPPDPGLPQDWAAATVDTALPAPRWWSAFGSDELNRLQDQALTRNNDLAAALARIVEAEAQLRQAGAALGPSVTGSADAARALRKASASSGSGVAAADRRNSFALGLNASYEVDFWGKNRAGVLSAEAALDASRFDRDTVRMTLTADVANSYFAVLALADRIRVTRAQLDNLREVLALIETQERLGATSGLELAQQRGAVAQYMSTLSNLDLQYRQALSALALLLGEAADGRPTQAAGLDGLRLPDYGAGLPSELLLRRPDIRAAEARLIAANADIGVARAQLFPSLTLGASGGASSTALNTLLDPVSTATTIAAGLTATIFDSGRLAAGVDLAEARKQELVASYRQAVLTAFGDVHDALQAVTLLAEQAVSQNEAETQAAEAYRIAAERYRAGAVNYQTLLETQRTLLQTQDSGVQLRQSRLQAAVGLARSLGGGSGGS